MQDDDETPTRIEQYWEGDSDDERERPKSAFPIPHDDDTPAPGETDAVPASAEDYLRAVREEAAALPHVFTTPKQVPPQVSHVIPRTISLAPAPDHLLPCETWVREQLEAFRRLQAQVQNQNQSNGDTAAPKDPAGWKRLFASTREPNLVILGGADYNGVACALRAVDESLYGTDGEKYYYYTKWLYALLVHIAPPLDGNTAATMRSVLRKLTYARLNVASTASSELGALNLLISIMSIHFKQG